MKFVRLLFLSALFVTTFGLDALMARSDQGDAYDPVCEVGQVLVTRPDGVRCEDALPLVQSPQTDQNNSDSNSNDHCGFDAGVWVCNRQTGLGVGNHSYLWDARTQESCGTGGSSTGGDNVSRAESGPTGDSCNFVPLSEGREDEIMDQCRRNANNGIWVPGVNDCHNAVDDSVSNAGLENPGAPGGRFGSREGGQSHLYNPAQK